MLISTLSILAGLAGLASAHFQLQYPEPRGLFVEDDEPSFCDGYISVTPNRTTFPLDNGHFTFVSEHPSWSMAVYASTVQNATSFQDFSNTSYAKPFFMGTGQGAVCIPIDLGTSNVSGLVDGANVTLQFLFNGGDGSLYQCADLTLSKNATIPSNVTCSNATSSASATAPASTHSGAKHVMSVHASVVALLCIFVIILSVI